MRTDAGHPEYRDYVLEQLSRIVPVSSRVMFGATAIYSAGFLFALIDDDTVYFKVDDSNRADFEGAGKGPFVPYSGAKPMPYYELPAELLEAPEELASWVEKAIAVARARKKTSKR
jgi:DNA transformation protein